ncbi:UNVERIFIED_CONTAM: Sugar transporter ERD6-like 6 [Sesamum calycinum]|uniref:Sugar transporter ERD6-like 6 n=1 Tax=Sesamum calycinum TaxID=2727403 RepID=A0AAW2MPY3_9LAMI
MVGAIASGQIAEYIGRKGRSVGSSSKQTAIRFSELKRKRYWYPLMILPVSIKSLAGSVATLANWLSASVVTMTANLLFTWSCGGTFLIYAIVSALTVVFVAFCVPETKGKTLEEIQLSFR